MYSNAQWAIVEAIKDLTKAVKELAGERVLTDELRIAIEECWDNDYATVEDYVAHLISKYNIIRGEK